MAFLPSSPRAWSENGGRERVYLTVRSTLAVTHARTPNETKRPSHFFPRRVRWFPFSELQEFKRITKNQIINGRIDDGSERWFSSGFSDSESWLNFQAWALKRALRKRLNLKFYFCSRSLCKFRKKDGRTVGNDMMWCYMDACESGHSKHLGQDRGKKRKKEKAKVRARGRKRRSEKG